MRAAVIEEGRLAIAERPDPEPGAGEVLIAVRAAGLNGADLAQLRGVYPAPPGHPPDIPGLELAGEVLATGARADRFEPGDRVMGIVGGGGQAERAVVHERQLMPVPDALDWASAGGFPEVFVTAHDALITQAGLEPGERLLVHGGAGGVGTAAIQLGRSLGARVTATVRSVELRESVSALGAGVIDPGDFQEHGPYDVILELVGAVNLGGDVRALASGGRIVVVGITGGASGELSLARLMARRGRVLGTMLRSRPLEEKALATRRVERNVLPLVEAGAVHVPVSATFPLQDAARAYERFAAGGKLGKLVLLPG